MDLSQISGYDHWYSHDITDPPSFAIKCKHGKNTLAMVLTHCDTYNDIPVYSVEINIAHKRKAIAASYSNPIQTGAGNISALVLSKQLLEEFQEVFFKNVEDHDKIIITVFATDPRRMRVYERSLSRIGYKLQNVSLGRCLLKVLERNVEYEPNPEPLK